MRGSALDRTKSEIARLANRKKGHILYISTKVDRARSSAAIQGFVLRPVPSFFGRTPQSGSKLHKAARCCGMRTLAWKSLALRRAEA